MIISLDPSAFATISWIRLLLSLIEVVLHPHLQMQFFGLLSNELYVNDGGKSITALTFSTWVCPFPID